MNRWMNVMLVAASILAPSIAPAARSQGHGPRTTPAVVVVPEEVVLATSGVATALERFRTGAVEETAGIDGVIGAVETLTRANAALEGAEEDVLVAAFELEYDTVAVDLATLMALADPATGEHIGEVTTDWLDSLVVRPNAGSEGPTSTCFRALADCFVWCSELLSPIARSLCGLDCANDYRICMGLTLHKPGPGGGTGGIGTVGSP